MSNRNYWMMFMKDPDAENTWQPEFGDFDKSTVEYEMDCYKQSYNYKNCKFKIKLTVNRKGAIDQLTRELNS